VNSLARPSAFKLKRAIMVDLPPARRRLSRISEVSPRFVFAGETAGVYLEKKIGCLQI
jgi:hypothetical protein